MKEMIKYKNPVLKGFNPDPSVCRVGGDYYLVTSTFEFFPGVPIYHSKNLVDWQLISYCLTEDSQLPLKGAKASGGIYAPTIRYHNKKFYMVTTNVSTGGHFYVTSESGKGRWSQPIWVDTFGIDPTLFFDDDGSAYFMSNGHPEKGGIALSEIDIQTGKLLNEPVLISNGSGGRYCEAPHIYKRQGYYYLLTAEGGTEYGHMSTIFRSKNIYGPYESCPRNPILSHRDYGLSPIQATGHADMFWDKDGNCWMVCLGIRPLPRCQLHNLGRETFLTPVEWENGWPIVGNNGTIELEMSGPLPEKPNQGKYYFSDKFENNKIDLEWNWVRNKDKTAYLVDNNELRLINKGVYLSSDDESPCFMGIRQKEFNMEFKASMRINRKSFGGITAYYNDSYHYDLYAREDNGKVYVGIRKRIHDMETVEKEIEIINTGAVKFLIKMSDEYYSFYYFDGSKYKILGKGLAAGLCTETTYRTTFTGTYLGLFEEQSESVFEEVTCRETT